MRTFPTIITMLSINKYQLNVIIMCMYNTAFWGIKFTFGRYIGVAFIEGLLNFVHKQFIWDLAYNYIYQLAFLQGGH